MKIIFSFFVLFLILTHHLIDVPEKALQYYKNKKDIIDENLVSMAEFYLDSKLFNKSKIILKIIVEKSKDQLLVEKTKFMLSEIEYSNRNYEKALEGYNKFIKEFPFGEHTPRAYSRVRELSSMTLKGNKKY